MRTGRLDDLDEVARGVLRGQEHQGLAGPLVKPVIRPGTLSAPVHVDIDLGPLADPHVGELGLLEVGVDPDLGERADGHQGLAAATLLPGLTFRRMTTPSISRTLAIGEIELRLGEVALGLHSFGAAWRTSGASGTVLFHDPIDFPCLSRHELFDGLLGRPGRRGSGGARPGRRPGRSQRLPDAREALVQVGGDLGQVPFSGCGGRPRETRVSETSSSA